MATDTLNGRNIVFSIYNEDGTPFHNLVLRKSVVDSIVMSLGDKISGDVYYKDNTLSVTMHEYITYNGVNYILVNPPTIVREGVVSDNSELKGMTKYSFVFYHPMCLLGNFPFSDVAVTSDQTRYLSEGKKFSWIGYPDDYIAKLNKNLEGTEWIVEKSSRFPQEKNDELSPVLPFDDATIADALKVWYDTWKLPYIVDKVSSTEATYAQGKRFKVVMGLASNEIYADVAHEQLGEPFVFQFGKGVGLKNNSRTPRNNKIVTRIAGYGSENNIPYGYPQIPWYGDSRWDYTEYEGDTIVYDADGHVTNTPKSTAYPLYMGIVGGAYIKLIQHPFTRKNLMPSIYGQTLFNKVSPYLSDGTANPNYNPNTTLVDYYDAIATQEYPYPNQIVANAPSYESHEFEDIKPELGQNIAIVDAYPINNDLTPASSWDDSIDDNGNYVQSYFKMQLPVLSFDIYACAAITQEMQINMRSGACLGCTFTVQVDWDDYKANFYDADGNFAPTGSQRDYTKYPDSSQEQITVVLQKDTATFGTIMPNVYQYPVANDTFVVLGISLPLSYITNAEARLDAEMKSYMLENNVHYFDYPLKFDEAFLRNHTYILSQIKPNAVIRFKYGNDTLQLFVKQLTVKYGDNPLPQYDITLTDNVEVVLNQIGRVAEDVEKLGAIIAAVRQNYNRSVWAELEKKLSKTQDDTAAGYIRMLKGLQVGSQFVPDILGQGGVFRMGADGKVELVTDRLYARVSAYFDNVEIRDYRHSGGNRIASQAQGFTCSRVEWIKVVSGNETVLEQIQENLSDVDFFRCYWRVDDGEKKTDNQFIVGDLAFCESANVDDDTLTTKRYWRVVVGRNSGNTTTADGEAWVDLSNAHNANGTPKMTTITYQGQGGVTQTMQVLSFENGSGIPEPKDDICQLGDVRDTTRQGAIIEYVTGVDAPSYQIFQGIGEDATNPYSLTNKNQITIGYNSATGHADLKVYGDAYIGDPNGSTFIEYKQDDGTEAHAPVLNIKARINASSTIGGQSLPDYIKNNQNNYNDAWVHSAVEDLQSQIDGEIDSYFYNYLPVANLDSKVPLTSVEPYKTWYETDGGGTASEVTTERTKHLADTFYDNSSGYAFRFTLNENTSAFEWTLITDSAVVQALANAAKAQETADGKRTVYSVWNAWVKNGVNTLKQGDLFIPASTTTQGGTTYKAKKVYKCTTDGSATFEEIEYTDDSALHSYIGQILNKTYASGDDVVAATAQRAIQGALNGGTLVDGGLLLTSLIAMRKLNAETQQYTTWAGISGMYDTDVFGGGIASWWGGAMVDHEVSPSVADYAKSLVRFDGSGYFAGGNITWDAQGRVAIKDITTLIAGSDTNILNALTTFNNAFHFNTQQGTTTVLSIVPQVGFTSLNITENGVLKPVATQEWVNGNFVTKTFFDNLFRVYNGAESAANKIDVNGTLPSDTSNLNIEAMFGFWTKKYISALGQGDDGTTSYTTLAQLNDVTLTNPTANQILVYDGTHWRNQNQQSVYELPVATTTTLGGIMLGYAASGKNYAIQLDANGKAYVNVPWSDTTYTLPTASADTLGGVKVGTTLAISNGVLNLPTTGVTAGTYKRVTVDAYGRVTSGDNTDTDTNTWRNIYVGGTSKVGTGIDTKAINFKAGSNVAISYVAAGTGSGQSGSANYFDVIISATDTTYSAATQSAAGLMSADDKKKLDGVAANANNYSLPLATSGTRGGVQIGFTTDAANRNYSVQLSSEKMYVNVPWENTWRGIQNNLTSDSTTDSLSAAQGKALKGSITTLEGYFTNGVAKSAAKLTTVSKTAWGQTFWTSSGVPTSISGSLSSVTNITMSGYIKIGDAYLTYDSTNNAIRVSANADGTGAMNFYARGGVSALGETADGQAGVGDVTWALLADGTDTRQIALSHLTTSLTTITGGTTDATNKRYAVYKNSSNQLFVDVPWQAGSGTVTSIKVGTTSYTPTNGVISLPAYPTSLPASDVYSWAKQSTKPTYAYSEITGTPTIPAAANNGTFSIKTLVGSTTTTISDFTANQSTADDFTLVQGANVTFTLDTTNRKLTIAAKDTTYTLAGLMGSSAKGSTTQPIYWTGSAFANTTYTLGKSVPSDAVFTDHYAWNDITGKPTTLSGYGITDALNKLTYEYSKEIAFGATGKLLIGKFPCYDSNVTIYLDATTNTTYHATIILATQNINNSHGGAIHFNVYGDETDSVAPNLYLYYPSNSRYIEIYFSPSAWSKNIIHIKCSALSAAPTNICESVSEIPSSATTKPTNVLNASASVNYATTAGSANSVAWANVSSRPTKLSQFTNDSGFVTSSGVTSVATGTGLTGGTITTSGTISINSTYQTYISHGETAYGWGNHANAGYAAGTTRNFTAGGSSWTVYAPYTTDVDLDSYYLRLSGGTMTGHIYLGGAQAESSTGNTSQIVFGTANTQYLSLSSNTNRLILNPATNGAVGQACISVGSQAFASYLAMNSGGKLGVGTSSPSEKLHVLGNILADNGNGSFVQIGNIRLVYDSANNAIKVIHSNGGNANLYATGGVSALGAGQESGSGGNYLPLSGGTMTGTINSAYYCLYYSSTNPYLELKGAGITTYVQNYQGSMYIGFSVSNSIKIDSDATLTTKNILVTDGSTGDSPYIEFRRGTNADDYTDWRIIDSGGYLYFRPKSIGENWSDRVYFGGSGIISSYGFTNLSDIRKKNVIKGIDLRLDQIAKAPAFKYYWLDPNIDHDLHVGTSAQYWQSVLPEVVSRAKDEMGTLSMQYGVAALISAITVARKVMTHEEKIALLETRVSALEKENGEQEMLISSLQEELSKYKAA